MAGDEKRRMTDFYPAPDSDPGEVPAWILAGGALVIVVALILILAGGIVLGGTILEAIL
jgi:hypothetical protein